MVGTAVGDLSVSARIAVLVFPGTNSEDETQRLLRDCGGDAELVHWSRAESLAGYDAYVLPGGFAHEDRVRAGAIAAHDRMMDFVIEGAAKGKMVLGVCNGAQILLEAGLVPGTGNVRRPTAAFTFNGPQPHFVCRLVHVTLSIEPSRSPITAALPAGATISGYTANVQGRLAATPEHLDEIVKGDHVAFIYTEADGSVRVSSGPDDSSVPNESALGAAGLINKAGNVLAIMPHAERDGWNFNHPDLRTGDDILAPSGGAVLFSSFVKAANG
jgi:phosphoribosylformylglycinamidine synthase subunit PurQ / glutaminase